ncbi:MAG: hypothetical protein ABFD89_22595 [Bryobacteraceae bacterium]
MRNTDDLTREQRRRFEPGMGLLPDPMALRRPAEQRRPGLIDLYGGEPEMTPALLPRWRQDTAETQPQTQTLASGQSQDIGAMLAQWLKRRREQQTGGGQGAMLADILQAGQAGR